MLFVQFIGDDLAFDFASIGKSIAARTAKMQIVIRSSMSVNAQADARQAVFIKILRTPLIR
jgi:hypothetical protein